VRACNVCNSWYSGHNIDHGKFLTSFVEISEKMKSVVEPSLSVSTAAGKSFIGVEYKLDDEGARGSCDDEIVAM